MTIYYQKLKHITTFSFITHTPTLNTSHSVTPIHNSSHPHILHPHPPSHSLTLTVPFTSHSPSRPSPNILPVVHSSLSLTVTPHPHSHPSPSQSSLTLTVIPHCHSHSSLSQSSLTLTVTPHPHSPPSLPAYLSICEKRMQYLIHHNERGEDEIHKGHHSNVVLQAAATEQTQNANTQHVRDSTSIVQHRSVTLDASPAYLLATSSLLLPSR